MADPDKQPNWGNRVILAVFALVAILTIGSVIIATTTEWNRLDASPETAAETVQ